MLTTTIGAYPKPDYVPLPDWFRAEGGTDTPDPTKGYAEAWAEWGEKLEGILDRATEEAVREQVDLGIDVPTDGEIRRENYIHYHCRHIAGIDFERLSEKTMRGHYRARLPTVRAPLAATAPFLVRDWRVAQAVTERPVKMTVPGPLTITDSIVDAHYGDPARLGRALAEVLNVEIRRLAEAGCRWIQVDEPLFARKTEEALSFGIENLERCFHGLPAGVTRCVHVCCGYPDHADREDYPKAPREAYFRLAPALDAAAVDAISIEDAHRHNDLRLLELFPRKTVMLGVIAIARSRVEEVEEVRARLEAALAHIDRRRLMAAPDCGLGLLSRDRVRAKLRVLAAAVCSL